MQQLDQILEVKRVKESSFFKIDDRFVCMHYQSVIFEAIRKDGQSAQMIKLYCPSTTSSKMAKRCFEYVFGYSPEFKEWAILKDKFK